MLTTTSSLAALIYRCQTGYGTWEELSKYSLTDYNMEINLKILKEIGTLVIYLFFSK